MSLLAVDDLSVSFRAGELEIEAVRKVSFTIERGETLALVGESGSGKSVTALSILQLLPYPKAWHPSGSVRLDGEELLGKSDAVLRQVRGNRASMIFQEPMTSLNPLHTVEQQIGEVLELHRGLMGDAIRARVLELLELVRIDEAETRLRSYPHQLSGGQRQRVMIAMALANEPDLLIADEPTTALDVTVQAQILALIAELQERLGMAVLLITHDLTIVRKVAHRVAVMTEGEIVESGPTEAIFTGAQHSYTRHLLAAEPKGAPPVADGSAPVILAGQDIKVHFPIQRGLLRRTVGHVKAVDGVTLEVRAGQTV
ncbi:MAG TPA: ATP-binding cassette domain-containing protein, partial [Geminicoccaceae bacterium]|nr:ATP-binding cassette domain-containing protein [Geminicoccaceae bacterium]